MRIFYSPYELKPRASLSSRASSEARRGALLKIEHEDFGFGYADLFPWPELGDQPLADQLSMLQNGFFTSLTRNSFVNTRADARARAEKKSLWEGLTIPKSHKLVTNPNSLLETKTIEAALENGFKIIKIKTGRDIDAEANLINELAKKLNNQAKLRLDFNSSLSKQEWKSFCDSLSEQALSSIDFIEDPIEWDQKTGFGDSPRTIALAVDREVDAVNDIQLCPDVLVVKPAVTDVTAALIKAKNWKKRIIFTSYLDHPLGQLWAAWSAASAVAEAPVDICGLLSQDAYEPNPFQELLKTKGPELIPPSGTGIGWDEELEKLCTWKELQ